MRILLTYPDTDPLSVIPSGLINIEPLGLEYLAGALPDHDVTILDMKIEKHWQRVVENCRPDIVGITGTVVHTTRMIEVLQYVKQTNPTAVTIVGGPHATLAPDDFAVPPVDLLVTGQRPDSFCRLVENLERSRPLDDIDGLMLKHDDHWRATRPTVPITSLDHYPMPRRDLTSAYRHRYRHLVWQPVALIVTSVGCPHACSFCPCPTLTGRRVLRRSPELVLEELLRIDEPYVYVGDDNLFFDYRHARRLADLIAEARLGKQFYVLSRVDDIIKHPDLVEKWAEIGLKKVFLGLESPDDAEIRSLNKKGSVSENSRAVRILRRNGVDPLGAFIIRPDYTRADFDRVLDYMDMMGIFYFEFTILTPFPGTPFYDESRADIISNDRRLFDLAHSLFPTTLPHRQFYREFSRLNRRAASPWRALRIRPTVSPFRRLVYLRRLPKVLELLFSARRAYRQMEKLLGDGNRAAAAQPLARVKNETAVRH